MPRTLSPIPQSVAITEQNGRINTFFRLRWEELRNGYQQVASVAAEPLVAQDTDLVLGSLFTTIHAGLYRVSYVIHKTVADGVSSALTVSLGWTRSGVALSQTFAALTNDTNTATQTGTILVRADASSDLTRAVVYASNTPNQMKYEADFTVEQLV